MRETGFPIIMEEERSKKEWRTSDAERKAALVLRSSACGGKFLRMGLTISKQLISLLGVPVLIHTLLALEKAQRIHEIILVVRKEDQPAIQQQVERFSLQKLSAFVEGGATASNLWKPGQPWLLRKRSILPFTTVPGRWCLPI